MKRFSLLSAIPFSFFSIAFYKDVAKNWRGLGFAYTLVLLLICAVVTQGVMAYKLSKIDVKQFVAEFYQNGLQADGAPSLEQVVNSLLDMAAQLPPVTFQDGMATSQVKQPYTVTEPITGKPVIIVDTTGEVTSLQGTEAFILLTAKGTVVRKNNNREQVDYYLSMDAGEQFALTIASHAIAQLPPMTLTNGRLQTDKARPYYIENLYNNEVIALIDTTGSITSPDQTDALILVTATHFYTSYIDDQGQEKKIAFLLADINEENLLQLMNEWLPTAKNWIMGFIFLGVPFIALVQFVIAMLVFLCTGGLGLLVAKIAGAKGLEYEITVRLAALSATPAIIALLVFGVPLLFAAVIAVVYLLFAVMINKNTLTETPNSLPNTD